MNTEKISWGLLIICVISLGWLCTRPEKVGNPIVSVALDSNTYYDEIVVMYQARQLGLYDSIEKLNNRVEKSKIIYRTKLKYIFKDSIKINDYSCCDLLVDANNIITEQDSLITIQSKSIFIYEGEVINLTGQVELNKKCATDQLKYNAILVNKNEKLTDKIKRNRLFSGIIAAILVSFVLLK